MPATRIILLCMGAAVLYGLIHDQITARICVEYFTIGHPRILPTDSPTLLALYWGVAATWWVGFLLGVPLAAACRFGSAPKLAPSQLVRPIAKLLICMATSAVAGGVAGYQLTLHGVIEPGAWARLIPPRSLPGFFADLFAHLASYGSAFLGGIVIIVWASLHRRRLAREAGGKSSHESLTPPASA